MPVRKMESKATEHLPVLIIYSFTNLAEAGVRLLLIHDLHLVNFGVPVTLHLAQTEVGGEGGGGGTDVGPCRTLQRFLLRADAGRS